MVNVILYNAMKRSITGGESFTSAMPLSLMALSSCLRQRGYSVKIVEGTSRRAKQDIEEGLDQALLFGISCMTGPSILQALRVAREVKERRPGIPVVWGGVHPTLLPEQTARHPLVDVVVRGMGEETIIDLVESLISRTSFQRVFGITYRVGETIVSTPERPIRNLDLFPMLDYSAVDTRRYAKTGPIPYISSRGCPHRCRFCAVSALYGRRWLSYSSDRILQELDYLITNFGMREVIFLDDNFFVNKERIDKICDVLIRKKMNLRWSAFGRCDYFSHYDTTFLRKLKESGLEWISFGVESGSSRILQFIRKDIRVDDVIKTVEKCKEIDVDADFSFMSGFPTETIEDLRATITLWDRMLAINPEISIRLFSFNPFPGTELLNDCIDEGFNPPNSLEEWGSLDYHDYIGTWVDPAHARLIQTLAWLTNFLSSRPIVSRNVRLNLLQLLLHNSAVIRFRSKFFQFPYEFSLLRFAHKYYYRR